MQEEQEEIVFVPGKHFAPDGEFLVRDQLSGEIKRLSIGGRPFRVAPERKFHTIDQLRDIKKNPIYPGQDDPVAFVSSFWNMQWRMEDTKLEDTTMQLYVEQFIEHALLLAKTEPQKLKEKKSFLNSDMLSLVNLYSQAKLQIEKEKKKEIRDVSDILKRIRDDAAFRHINKFDGSTTSDKNGLKWAENVRRVAAAILRRAGATNRQDLFLTQLYNKMSSSVAEIIDREAKNHLTSFGSEMTLEQCLTFISTRWVSTEYEFKPWCDFSFLPSTVRGLSPVDATNKFVKAIAACENAGLKLNELTKKHHLILCGGEKFLEHLLNSRVVVKTISFDDLLQIARTTKSFGKGAILNNSDPQKIRYISPSSKDKSLSNSKHYQVSNKPEKKAEKTNTASGAPKVHSDRKCYHCNKPGHHWRTCKLPAEKKNFKFAPNSFSAPKSMSATEKAEKKGADSNDEYKDDNDVVSFEVAIDRESEQPSQREMSFIKALLADSKQSLINCVEVESSSNIVTDGDILLSEDRCSENSGTSLSDDFNCFSLKNNIISLSLSHHDDNKLAHDLFMMNIRDMDDTNDDVNEHICMKKLEASLSHHAPCHDIESHYLEMSQSDNELKVDGEAEQNMDETEPLPPNAETLETDTWATKKELQAMENKLININKELVATNYRMLHDILFVVNKLEKELSTKDHLNHVYGELRKGQERLQKSLSELKGYLEATVTRPQNSWRGGRGRGRKRNRESGPRYEESKYQAHSNPPPRSSSSRAQEEYDPNRPHLDTHSQNRSSPRNASQNLTARGKMPSIFDAI